MGTEVDEEYLDACPLCKGRRLDDYLESNGRSIVQCKNCGLLFVNPRPGQAAIRKLFLNEYIESEERVSEHFTDWRHDSLKREAALVQELLPAGGRLLDLGTASGAFLGFFCGQDHWHVEGIEPSAYAARSASERYGVPVHPGFLQDRQYPDNSFDVVTSLDAFMFHPQPQEDLAEIARILRPGGLLAVEIPGLRFRLLKNSGLLCRLIYGAPARLNAGVHLFYYSRETLGRLMAQHGMREELGVPERSPLHGSTVFRLLSKSYYAVASAAYRITSGASWVPVPKEFLIYRKETS